MKSVSETNKQKKEKKLRRGQILFNSSVCVLLVIYGVKNYHRVHTLKHESPRVNTWLLYVQLYIKYVFIFWRFDILVYRNGHTNKAYFNFNGPIKQKKKKCN